MYVKTHLDAQLGGLWRAIGGILALAGERRVVVFLARRHRQAGLHRDERPVLVRDLLRLDALLQHCAQAVDPRDLRTQIQKMIRYIRVVEGCI